MRKAISDALNLQPSADGEGYAWAPPANLPQRTIDEATRAAQQLEQALAPAPDFVKLQWLAQLAKLTGGNASLAEILERIKALAADLDYPALCFTDATRRDAAYRFKFFPTFAELARFLEEVQAPYRDRVRRLKRVAGANVEAEQRGRAWHELTDDERRAHEQLMERVRERLKATAPASEQQEQQT